MLMFDPYTHVEPDPAALPEGEEPPRFSYLMRVLSERSLDAWEDRNGDLRPRLTTAERGLQCVQWANHYGATDPQLGEDLRIVAQRFVASLAFSSPAKEA